MIRERPGRLEQLEMSPMMWWGNGGWGVGGWIAMSLMMLLFLGGLIALVVWAVRGWGSDRATGTTPPRPSADETLAERFARGEISEDEFARRREALHPGTKSSP